MKSKRLLAALMTVSIVSSAALVGCGNKSTNENTGGNENKQEASNENNDGSEMDKVQYLNMLLQSEPKSIDPSRSSDSYSSDVIAQITEGLTRVEKTENGDVITPGIAEKWEHNEDGTVWTFHLRDAKWNDGVSVKAQDFEYGIKRTLDPETGSPYSWLITPIIKNAAAYNAGEVEADAIGVKVIDDKTIEFTLEVPCAYFLDLTYFRVMMPQRQDVIEKYGEAYGSEAEQMVSCGPFVVKNWEHQSKFEFEKNPTYWDADTVKLDKVTMHIIKDENAKMNSLFNGSIDLAPVTKPEWQKKFDQLGKFDFDDSVEARTAFEIFNQNSRYFKNAKVRKAFICALDRENLAKTIYRGTVDPAFSWCPPSVQIGGEDFREKANADWIKKLQEENPDAKALLIEGLKELGEDPDPAKMEVLRIHGNTSARGREFVEFEQQVYKSVLGVDVKVDYMEWAIFSERVKKGDYEFGSMAWTGDYNDPMTFFEIFKSTAGIYTTEWVNEEYDQLIDKAATTMDQEERFNSFKRAEEILLYEDGVVSPWVYFKLSTYKAKYVKGYQRPLFGPKNLKHCYTVGREK